MNFIIYDLEATCWDPHPPELAQETIEIGALKINRFGENLGAFSRFVKPIINPFLSPFCLQLTHIDQSMINQAENFNTVSQDFAEWIGIYEEPYTLCSWGKFDQKLLLADAALHNLDDNWISTSHINLKQQYARIKKISKPIGLKQAVRKERFEFTGEHHRAISDAENTAKIFLKFFEEWDYER